MSKGIYKLRENNMKIKKRSRRLTPEQKAKIATDYNAGLKVKDILKKHKISVATLYRTINHLV